MFPEMTPAIFAEVLLPLPLGETFTYRVPEELTRQVKPGIRVVVRFGSRKIYTALVIRVHQTLPEGFEVKEILSVLDDRPIIHPIQWKFWEWISAYYMCHPGEVMNAAFPAALKLTSESAIRLNTLMVADFDRLSPKEQLLMEAMGHRKRIRVAEVSGILGIQKVIPVIRNLLEKGLILMEEDLDDPYRPKKEYFIRFAEKYQNNEELLRGLFDQLENKGKRQLDLLMNFVVQSHYGSDHPEEVSRATLLKSAAGAPAALTALLKKGVLEIYEREKVSLQETHHGPDPDSIDLNFIQEMAIGSIRTLFQEKEVVLLHGVTSSGKTEIYIKLIKEVLEQGKQVLYLLPEIALTTQTIERLRRYFGSTVSVYHSRFNDAERAETWNRVLEDTGARIVLGARSAVFLPFSKLGLVIVDEEHDPSYKQNDPAPRYLGRDAALYLAYLHGAKTLLGSATPCLESYYNATEGKYGLVELHERYGNVEMPAIEVVDLKSELRAKRMKSHFSSVLINRLTTALENGEQAILFQNRRGFSPRLECDACNWMPSCRNCDVTLVYHKSGDLLRCHYCGYSVHVPSVCPSCKGTVLRMKGFGTEKVEEELTTLFSQARIARMDLDTTRSKNAYRNILERFDRREIDILVGTQMITKGLDFEHVSTVCILNADNLLSFPDFRAYERAFQLMAQVSGRAGRKSKQGIVLIQTHQPGHPVIRDVVANDYRSLYEQQLLDRRKFRYPPYYRLIQVRVKHKDPKALNTAAAALATALRKRFGNRVLGPEYPPVSRIMNYYIKHILIKFERTVSLSSEKKRITDILAEFMKNQESASVRLNVDVDPQ